MTTTVTFKDGDRVKFSEGSLGRATLSEPYFVRGKELSTVMTLSGQSVWVEWDDGEVGWARVDRVELVNWVERATQLRRDVEALSKKAEESERNLQLVLLKMNAAEYVKYAAAAAAEALSELDR